MVAMLRQQRDIKDVKIVSAAVKIQASDVAVFYAYDLVGCLGMLRRIMVPLRLPLHTHKLLLLLRRPRHLRQFLLARAAIHLEQKIIVGFLHGSKCYLAVGHYDLRKRWNTAS